MNPLVQFAVVTKWLPPSFCVSNIERMNAKRCASSCSKQKHIKSDVVRIWMKLSLGYMAGIAFLAQAFIPTTGGLAMSLSLLLCLILLGEKTPAERLAQTLSKLFKIGR